MQKTVSFRIGDREVELEFHDDVQRLSAAVAMLAGFASTSAEQSLRFDTPFLATSDPPMNITHGDDGRAHLLFSFQIGDNWLRPIAISLSEENKAGLIRALSNPHG